jgi:hypothetical protein
MAITSDCLVVGRYTDLGGESQCFLRQPDGTIIEITIPGAISATGCPFHNTVR